MIRAYFMEFLFAGALLWLFGWGLCRLGLWLRGQLSAERQVDLQIKREAEEALDDLERATQAHRKDYP